jgi:hypothetical protein
MGMYRTHYGGAPGVEPSFGIVVDSDSLTWTSDPPGNDLRKPMLLYFTGGDHSIGSGKQFVRYIRVGAPALCATGISPPASHEKTKPSRENDIHGRADASDGERDIEKRL